jgi:hypothetical protein
VVDRYGLHGAHADWANCHSTVGINQNSFNSGAGDASAQKAEKGTESPKVPATDGSFGQVIDAPNPDKEDAPATSWTGAVEQAEVVARMAGKAPGGVRRAMEAADRATVDWQVLIQ